MNEQTFTMLVYTWIAVGLLLFPLLLRIPAPYGRHSRPGWGVRIPDRLGWFLMELPALVVFGFFFLAGPVKQSLVAWFFFGLWGLHYANRTLVFPLRINAREKKMPVLVALMAFGFNLVNGFFNGYYFGFLAPHYPLDWCLDPRFIFGAILFFLGAGTNVWADNILIRLRKFGQGQYSIPRGGMFRHISCPNYLGELMEWGGYALMVWSLPALSFFIWTLVNLIPRALDHHRWYKKQFEDYPSERKALIPFLI
jgi:hypothetical protein